MPADRFARHTWVSPGLDVDRLLRARRAQGTRVSVVLPARNEAATIGGVLDACRAWEGRLVDEVVVLDGASEDDTAAIAEARGARVYRDGEILPHWGPSLGKGDALWRSLTVTSGDLVVWLDADVVEPGHHYLPGLLAPLLLDDRVQLVKGFYDRPLTVEGALLDHGGGRVTELLARPLLNLFWPELGWLVQPLAGEYAGRRQLLESLPFATGYGVELAMLVDTLRLVGVDAIAQVDLVRRVHRNQDLQALSTMAYGILQVVARRLEAEGRLRELGTVPQYVQFTRTGAGVRPAARTVSFPERPPIRALHG